MHKHIKHTFFLKFVTACSALSSLVLTTGCSKLSGKYGMNGNAPSSYRHQQSILSSFSNASDHSIPSLPDCQRALTEAVASIKSDARKDKLDITTSFHHAVCTSDLRRLSQLCEDNPSYVNGKIMHDLTPLHLASYLGKHNLVELLLRYNALSDASMQDHAIQPIHFAAYSGSVDCIKLLCPVQTDLTVKDSNGSTPLHWASWKGNKDCVRELLSRLIDVNQVNNEGKTALHMAAQQGHIELVEALLNAGADRNILDQHGKAPLAYAQESDNPNMIGLLDNYVQESHNENMIDFLHNYLQQLANPEEDNQGMQTFLQDRMNLFLEDEEAEVEDQTRQVVLLPRVFEYEGCHICLAKGGVQQLPCCRQYVHQECIEEWDRHQPSCSTCRRPLDYIDW